MNIVRNVCALVILSIVVLCSGCTKREKTAAGVLIGGVAGAGIGGAAGGAGGAVAGGILGGVTGGLIGNSQGDDVE